MLVGSNGQGKTNLAEAIVFLATLGSHRVSSDAPMVRDGQDFAVIRARLAHDTRKVLAEVQVNRQGSKQGAHQRIALEDQRAPRYAHVVLFTPKTCRSCAVTRPRAEDSLISC